MKKMRGQARNAGSPTVERSDFRTIALGCDAVLLKLILDLRGFPGNLLCWGNLKRRLVSETDLREEVVVVQTSEVRVEGRSGVRGSPDCASKQLRKAEQ